jgi:hypothetical protein
MPHASSSDHRMSQAMRGCRSSIASNTCDHSVTLLPRDARGDSVTRCLTRSIYVDDGSCKCVA